MEPGSAVRLYSPPYILAPPKNQQAQQVDSNADSAEKSNIVFVAYCLSHDQRSLLAVATDNQGEMLDTCVINIHIPNRYWLVLCCGSGVIVMVVIVAQEE